MQGSTIGILRICGNLCVVKWIRSIRNWGIILKWNHVSHVKWLSCGLTDLTKPVLWAQCRVLLSLFACYLRNFLWNVRRTCPRIPGLSFLCLKELDPADAKFRDICVWIDQLSFIFIFLLAFSHPFWIYFSQNFFTDSHGAVPVHTSWGSGSQCTNHIKSLT